MNARYARLMPALSVKKNNLLVHPVNTVQFADGGIEFVWPVAHL